MRTHSTWYNTFVWSASAGRVRRSQCCAVAAVSCVATSVRDAWPNFPSLKALLSLPLAHSRASRSLLVASPPSWQCNPSQHGRGAGGLVVTTLAAAQSRSQQAWLGVARPVPVQLAPGPRPCHQQSRQPGPHPQAHQPERPASTQAWSCAHPDHAPGRRLQVHRHPPHPRPPQTAACRWWPPQSRLRPAQRQPQRPMTRPPSLHHHTMRVINYVRRSTHLVVKVPVRQCSCDAPEVLVAATVADVIQYLKPARSLEPSDGLQTAAPVIPSMSSVTSRSARRIGAIRAHGRWRQQLACDAPRPHGPAGAQRSPGNGARRPHPPLKARHHQPPMGCVRVSKGHQPRHPPHHIKPARTITQS